MKLILTIVMLFITLHAYAALNKWVDAEGKVNYSDSRPSDQKTTTLKKSTSAESTAPASGVVAPKSLAERDLEWKKAQQDKEGAEHKAALEKENASIKQKNCENARGYLTTLENSPVLVTYDAKGERSYVDDTSRAQRTEEARKAVSTNCN